MQTYFISMGLSVIFQLLKDENQRTVFRSAMLKLRNAINTAFAADPDFK